MALWTPDCGEPVPDIIWAPVAYGLDFKEPEKKTDHAAAYDFYAPSYETFRPGEVVSIDLNLLCFMPENYMAILMGRSGIARKYALVPLGGLIDSDYDKGWVFNSVMVPDPSLPCRDGRHIDVHDDKYFPLDQSYRFDKGERLGQIVFIEKPKLTSGSMSREALLEYHQARQAKAKKKRKGGHGSTGRH
jgi:dUTPase